MRLPIYELKINENESSEAEVSYIALVDEPAIKKDFIAFREENFIEPVTGESKDDYMKRCIEYAVGEEGNEPNQAVAICDGVWSRFTEERSVKEIGFRITNEEQRIITGPLMLADELIYRNNDKFGEHYVKFSAETIKKIAIKFAKKKYNTNVNLMHDKDQSVSGVTMFESWLVDKARGVKPTSDFPEVPDGSWFGSFYVENEEVWKSIREKGLRGFSVEGVFEYDEPITAEENALKKIGSLLNELSED